MARHWERKSTRTRITRSTRTAGVAGHVVIFTAVGLLAACSSDTIDHKSDKSLGGTGGVVDTEAGGAAGYAEDVQGSGGATSGGGAGGNNRLTFAASRYDPERDCFWDPEPIDALYCERQLEGYMSSSTDIACVISPTDDTYLTFMGGELAIVPTDPTAGWRVPEWVPGSSNVFYYDDFSPEEWALCETAREAWNWATPETVCTNAELAPGWDTSTEADLGSPFTVRQEVCGTIQFELGSPRIIWGGTDCGVVAVENLTVRCGQTLCGFVTTDGETAQALIRPCDMDPDQIAQCVCTTRIEFDAPEGAETVEISQQGDNVGGAQPPAVIGTAECVPGN